MVKKEKLKSKLLKELREREERYSNIAETSPDAIITAASDGRILTMNHAGLKMFGYGPEIIGQTVEKLIPPHLREAHREGVRRYLATKVPHIIGQVVELSALRADGTVFPVELTLSAWEGTEGVVFGSIIRDISQRKKIESVKEDVAHMISHDLRSPLVGIVGLANRLAVSDNLAPKQVKAVLTISELGQRMLNMLDRSRDFLQLKEGTYQLRPEAVNLFMITQKVKYQLKEMATARQVRVRIIRILDKKEKPQINGDPLLLENLFTNLVKNAIEASPANNPVEISFARVALKQASAWRVDVHNQGVIPLEVRTRFFDAYVTAGKPHGSGLGTHNAMMVARAHGGEISFTTDDEQGTHLLVDLPEKPHGQNR
ncbi:MAG: PAS domain-containing sensor histidine kinase [Deltaproteobacteria bacterium]|nr:PAS domain-containing sensor histidine kinase [Deltaproteobacteria bacterium]